MFKIVFIRKRVRHRAPDAFDPFDRPVVEFHPPVHRRVAHAFIKAPVEHRIITFLVMVGLWVVFEYVLKYEQVAHGVEVFGVAPFADRFLKALLGD